MTAPQAPRRRRFPLQLGDTQPTLRRLVGPGPVGGEHLPAVQARGRGPAALSSAPASTPPLGMPPATVTPAMVPAVVPAGVDPAQPPASAVTAPMPAARPTLRRSGLPPWPEPVAEGATARLRMVERLRQAGCADEDVLRAMGHVARHQFIDAALAPQAYEDTSLPIGLGQTISKPSVVARMLALLRARPEGSDLGRVLEIGTGCGYQAAVLVLLARQVYSVERLRGLYDRARENLAPTRPSHLRLVYGDGRLGHGPNAPYDGIIAAAGGQDLPGAWLEQLAPGGRLVAPVHDARLGSQVLLVVDRRADGSYVEQRHEPVRFVPLESGISDHGTP